MKTNWSMKKLGEIFKKSSVSTPIFDFYLNDIDVVIGRIDDFRQSTLLNNIKSDINREVKITELGTKESINNFGYSADWHLILVEWFAKDDWANAIANLGGLLAFSQYFLSLWKKLKNKYGDKLRVGALSARLLSFGIVFEKEYQKTQKFNYEILFEKEIAKQGSFEEKDFIFVISRMLEGCDLKTFFVHVDWLGNVKNFYEI